MRVPWPGTRCILCLKQGDLTIEYLVPKALGGSLTCRFVCPHRNSLLGASFEASARTDPSIRLAVANPRNKILPRLAEQLTERQPYIAKSLGGKERLASTEVVEIR